MKFSVYFMGYESIEDIPEDEAEKTKFMLTRRATIELTQLSIVFVQFPELLTNLLLFTVCIFLNRKENITVV